MDSPVALGTRAYDGQLEVVATHRRMRFLALEPCETRRNLREVLQPRRALLQVPHEPAHRRLLELRRPAVCLQKTALSGEGRADVHPPGIRVSSPGIGDYGDDVAATRAASSFLPSGQVDAQNSQDLRPIVSAI